MVGRIIKSPNQIASPKEIRFGVRAVSGHRAATWRAWVEESKNKKPEFYFVCREMKGQFKLSLHASGMWHVAFSEQFLNENFPSENKPSSRFLKTWHRKTENIGVTLAFRVIVPWFSHKVKVISTDEHIVWVAPAPEGQSVVFYIVLTTPETVVLDWSVKESMGTMLVGSVRAQSGETLLVVHALETPPIPVPPTGCATLVGGAKQSDLKSANLRAIAFADVGDGSFAFYDLPATVESA